MGFFERKLGALGEAMDDGLDRARDRTRDMCDRRGWSERAGGLRERVRDRAEEAWVGAGRRWRELDERGRRGLVAGAGLFAVLLAVAAVRSVAFRERPGPTAAEIELIGAVRERSEARRPWSTGPAAPSPWTWSE